MTREEEIKQLRRKHFQKKEWCLDCHKGIPYNKPCEHVEAKRKANMEKFEEDNVEDTPAQIEVKMWKIATRLQYVHHVKGESDPMLPRPAHPPEFWGGGKK